MKIIRSLRGIKRGDPQEKFLRAYAKVMEGLGAVKIRFAEALPLCWEKIPEMQYEKLWKSMPDRLQAVVEAKGWQTTGLAYPNPNLRIYGFVIRP